MQKILITVHLGRHFRIFGHYDLQVFKKMGLEVHIAANFTDDLDRFDYPGITKHQIDFLRNPFTIGNLRALRQLIVLLRKNHFDCVLTQSPVGGALTRIASAIALKRSKIVYTAHGFHFFKGAPILNWLIYFPIEKILSFFTERIITINHEDESFARSYLNPSRVDYIPGVGVDLKRYFSVTPEQKLQLRKIHGFGSSDFIMICVGELNDVKRQDIIIEALAKIQVECKNCLLLLAGTGANRVRLEKLVRMSGLENNVSFLGFRNDVPLLLSLADVSISMSSREGLPLSILEAMATGLPLIVSDCRGNRDLVVPKKNGFLVEFGDVDGLAYAIQELYSDPSLRKRFGSESRNLVQKYSIEKVESEMVRIFKSLLSNEKKSTSGEVYVK